MAKNEVTIKCKLEIIRNSWDKDSFIYINVTKDTRIFQIHKRFPLFFFSFQRDTIVTRLKNDENCVENEIYISVLNNLSIRLRPIYPAGLNGLIYQKFNKLHVSVE